MHITKNHIRNTKHFFLTWFVLFALSPCVVKEALFSQVNITYAKPLNKSKTTSLTNSCQYSQNDNQQISVSKQLKINKEIEPVSSFDNPYFVIYRPKINSKYYKTFSGNSPPKYILYKRLKIDIV